MCRPVVRKHVRANTRNGRKKRKTRCASCAACSCRCGLSVTCMCSVGRVSQVAAAAAAARRKSTMQFLSNHTELQKQRLVHCNKNVTSWHCCHAMFLIFPLVAGSGSNPSATKAVRAVTEATAAATVSKAEANATATAKAAAATAIVGCCSNSELLQQQQQ